MKVICKKNTAKGLDLNEVKTLYIDEYRYPLVKEKEYIVMGIAIYKNSNCIYYLVDEFEFPDWAPYMLFEISDKQFPPSWYINVIDKKKFEGSVFSLSGFYELCNDEKYYYDLVERDQKALDIYAKRKYELQEWYFEKG